MDTPWTTPQLADAIVAERTRLRVPGHPDWVVPTVEFLRAKAVQCGVCCEARGRRLTIALHEALTNSIVHGNLELSSALKEAPGDAFARQLAERTADPTYSERTVDILIDYDGSSCHWTLTDAGQGFDVDRVLNRGDDDPAALLASGRGLAMMRAFLDDVRYEQGGRRVVLTLNRPGAERRHEARQPVQAPLRVAPLRPDGSVDWEAAYQAVSRNLSAGGVCVLQEQLATSGRVLITLDVGGEPMYLPAEVRHCRQVGEEMFEIGFSFRPTPTAETDLAAESAADVQAAVAALLERLPVSGMAHDDRRFHPRVVYTERVTLFDPDGGRPAHIYARDLSKGGIAFISTAPVPHRSLRLLALPQGEGRPPLRLWARIVRCVQVVDGLYDVAAEFIGLGEAPS